MALQSLFVGEEVQAVLAAEAPTLQGGLAVQDQAAMETFQMALAGVGAWNLSPFSLAFLCLVRKCL